MGRRVVLLVASGLRNPIGFLGRAHHPAPMRHVVAGTAPSLASSRAFPATQEPYRQWATRARTFLPGHVCPPTRSLSACRGWRINGGLDLQRGCLTVNEVVRTGGGGPSGRQPCRGAAYAGIPLGEHGQAEHKKRSWRHTVSSARRVWANSSRSHGFVMIRQDLTDLVIGSIEMLSRHDHNGNRDHWQIVRNRWMSSPPSMRGMAQSVVMASKRARRLLQCLGTVYCRRDGKARQLKKGRQQRQHVPVVIDHEHSRFGVRRPVPPSLSRLPHLLSVTTVSIGRCSKQNRSVLVGYGDNRGTKTDNSTTLREVRRSSWHASHSVTPVDSGHVGATRV